jgi:hypothetical protein
MLVFLSFVLNYVFYLNIFPVFPFISVLMVSIDPTCNKLNEHQKYVEVLTSKMSKCGFMCIKLKAVSRACLEVIIEGLTPEETVLIGW